MPASPAVKPPLFFFRSFSPCMTFSGRPLPLLALSATSHRKPYNRKVTYILRGEVD